jgi:methylphosphotriester-DNA--protein-cysteine methyltransferase
MLRILLLLLLSVSLKAQTVYKTPSGKKYHTATCSMVKNVSQAITVKEAVAIGLEPCKRCAPALLQAGVAAKKENGVAQTVQCRGLTKKGTRCKHRTKIGNGYCFQHTPKKRGF